MVRAGIMLYGLHPSKETEKNAALRPAMELKSHITCIREILPGDGCELWGNLYGGFGQESGDGMRRVWRRIPAESFRKGNDPGPWKTGADFRADLYGSVYGGRDGNPGGKRVGAGDASWKRGRGRDFHERSWRPPAAVFTMRFPASLGNGCQDGIFIMESRWELYPGWMENTRDLRRKRDPSDADKGGAAPGAE